MIEMSPVLLTSRCGGFLDRTEYKKKEGSGPLRLMFNRIMYGDHIMNVTEVAHIFAFHLFTITPHACTYEIEGTLNFWCCRYFQRGLNSRSLIGECESAKE